MPLDNDTRGWIMTAMSGLACILGASIICVDLAVRWIPGMRNFKIENSNPFLSSSLGLSSGVMLFSALYSMLPSAKTSLQKGGFGPQAASWTLVACFVAGAVGIQLLSRVLHHYIPSHVVDCDHSHGDEEQGADDKAGAANGRANRSLIDHEEEQHLDGDHHDGAHYSHPYKDRSHDSHPLAAVRSNPELQQSNAAQRPSLTKKVSNLVTGRKEMCDEHGRCFGYSDPCGRDCFTFVQARGGSRAPPTSNHPFKPAGLSRSATTPIPTSAAMASDLLHPVAEEMDETSPLLLQSGQPPRQQYATVGGGATHDVLLSPNGHAPRTRSKSSPRSSSIRTSISTTGDNDDYDENNDHSSDAAPGSPHGTHHHHVPANAFLSIGLQTSVAIALHKLPEGFITYATNHANPRLGLAVFVALFVHNLTEGFAMALPLYLAVRSRGRAMAWSAVLGGASQPLGAGVAALWLKAAGNGGNGSVEGPGEGVYGGMFAVVAGIMASVGLQLFSEALDLTHNRNLCLAFVFLGMGVLGCASALTA